MTLKTKLTAIAAACIVTVMATPAYAFDPDGVETFLNEINQRACVGRLDTRWSSDGGVLFADDSAGSIRKLDGETGAVTDWVTKDNLAAALNKARARERGEVDVSLGDVSSDGKTLDISVGDARWRYDVSTGSAVKVSDDEIAAARLGQPRFIRRIFPMPGAYAFEEPSPDGSLLLGLLDDGNIGLRPADAPTPTPLTSDGSEDVMYANALFTNFERSSWSPDNAYAAITRIDMRHVEGLLIVDWTKTPEQVERFKLLGDRAGDPLPKEGFFVLDVESRDLTPVNIEPSTEHFLSQVGWRPGTNEFWFVRTNRAYTEAALLAADAKTGEVRVVLRDKRTDGFIEHNAANIANNIFFHPNGDEFVFLSDISGMKGAYVYDAEGSRKRKLTNKKIRVDSVEAIDAETGYVYFHGSNMGARPYDKHFYRIPFGGGPAEQLTQAPGWHSASLSPDFSLFVDIHEDFDRPAQTEVRKANGEAIAVIAENNAASDQAAGWSTPERFVVKAADRRTDMHGVIIKPRNFDPNKRYPVIERGYAGMQTTAGPTSYMGWECNERGPYKDYNNMLAYLTDAGYAVVIMDAPGTPGRERSFGLRPWGKWPDGIIEDHVAGLAALEERYPYLDMDRLGFDGNSWGGYMALAALIRAPSVYRAAAASVPSVANAEGFNWEEVALGGVPEERPDAYENANLLAKVDDIEGALLIVSGTSDANVPVSNTMKLLDALVDAGKPYELVMFPGTDHDHDLVDGRNRYPYAVERIREFFDNALNDQQK